jgi:large subunit ribosomal protein L29
MKYTEIKDLSVTELKKNSLKKMEELYEMKVKNNLGQLANPLQIRFLKKDIARMKTALTSKSAGAK